MRRYAILLGLIAGCADPDPGAEHRPPETRTAPIVQEAYVKASNTVPDGFFQSALFGESVAFSTDGKTFAIGAPSEDRPQDSGAVYVFTRDDSGWSQQTYLKSPSVVAANFGTDVALSTDGSTLAVGAPGVGQAYVFRRDGATWSEQAVLAASNPTANDSFATSVALSADGTTLAVGAPYEDGVSGAAYVFVQAGDAWMPQAILKASNADAYDGLGLDLALSADGSTLVASAGGEDSDTGDPADNSAENAGAVYVFARHGTTWSQEAYVKPPAPHRFDGFGVSVAISADGSTLVAGVLTEGPEEGQSDAPGQWAGGVHVFARDDGAWTPVAYLEASNRLAQAFFGRSVALSPDGSKMAVGAPQESSADHWAGAAYLFERSGGAWSERAYVQASNPGQDDGFGWSVSFSGDGSRLVIGAPEEQSRATGIDGDQADDSIAQAGAAYLFQITD